MAICKEIDVDKKTVELPSYIFKTFNILEIDDIFLEIKFPNKSRIELSFNKTDEEIYFKSKTPMRIYKKKVGLGELENGISIITQSNIITLVEIKIEK